MFIDEDKLKVVKKESYKINDNYDKNSDTFEAFRALRKEIAEHSNVPAYIVFSDKTLALLSQNLPQTKADMLMVNGIGEVKYERYGEQFLELSQSLKKS